MKVRWTGLALRDVERIGDFVSQTDPGRALVTVRSIFEMAKSLSQHPWRGRAASNGRPWRELILRPLPYLIVYEVADAEVRILRIWHNAQNRYGRSRKKRS